MDQIRQNLPEFLQTPQAFNVLLIIAGVVLLFFVYFLWKNIMKMVFVAILLAAAYVGYFFYFRDDGQSLNTDKIQHDASTVKESGESIIKAKAKIDAVLSPYLQEKKVDSDAKLSVENKK